jgi:nitrous oxide reductase accessory protein NosL
MKRRELLKFSALGGAMAAAGLVQAHEGKHEIPAPATGAACAADGTPNQFIPKKPADPKPLENELEKYGKCPYCGMDRKEHHRTRMLVQYSDDLVDGVCSIHCLALSLSLNIDREPKKIWGPDYAVTTPYAPMIEVEKLQYLIGADLKHAMTKRSKHSFASAEAMKEFQGKNGGTPGDFNAALEATYLDMSKDVAQIRKNREERRKRAAAKAS